jgi:hypothetical protein
VASKEGYALESGVYRGLECYNNTCLSHKGRDLGWVKRVGGLVLGNVDIQILGYWNGRSEDWVLR